MSSVSDIKLIRTDTTLDLSQKAEKRCPFRSSGPRVVGSFPIPDMVVAILSHPMMQLVLTRRTGTYHWLSTKTDTRPALDNSTV